MKNPATIPAAAAALLAAALLTAFPAAAPAQNLNPTVEVTNAYQTKHMEANKPMIEMAVPDSVMHFDIDFNYSISPNPYKGSYDFSPYVIDVRPESYAERDRTLFLRVGAGYSLHPTVDIVYTPRFSSGKFSMSIYGSHRSYFGRYRSIGANLPGSGSASAAYGGDIAALASASSSSASSSATIPASSASGSSEAVLGWDRNSKYGGYDASTDAGIYGRADWDTGFFSFDVGYTGRACRDTSLRHSFDMVHAQLRVASRKQKDRYFFYDFSASYLYGSDRARTVGSVSAVPCADSKASLTEQDVSVRASLGPVFSPESKLLFDVGFDLSRYGSYFSSYSGIFNVNPKYVLRRNRWLLSLGVNISAMIGADNTVWPSYGDLTYVAGTMHGRKGQYLYPDIRIGFDAVREHLNLYLSATGGDDVNRYSSMAGRNPFLSLDYAWNYAGMQLMDDTVERVNARFGLQGNIAFKFSYNIYCGYAVYKGLPIDAVVASADWSTLAPAYNYADCRYRYAAVELGWHSADVAADLRLMGVSTDLHKRTYAGFEPSPLSGSFNITYNWRRRIYVGLHAEGTSKRSGTAAVMETYTSALSGAAESSLVCGGPCRIPGWLDLGLSAEYRFNRTLSVWAWGGNLLNQTIRLTPLRCASGISLTAGITLTL